MVTVVTKVASARVTLVAQESVLAAIVGCSIFWLADSSE